MADDVMIDRRLVSNATGSIFDRQALTEALLNADSQAARQDFCRKAAARLANVASWFSVDAFLDGGDVPASWHLSMADARQDPDRHAAFLGAATVVQIASELSSGTIALLDAGHHYAAAALRRQLIETEYLVEAFADDFGRAADWLRASPTEVRRGYPPRIMRELGGFSNSEYRTHCAHGGHPAPEGRHLLKFTAAHSPIDDELWRASSWGDLAQHLRRVWSSVCRLLAAQHARFVVVRSDDIRAVDDVENRWMATDPIAQGVSLSSQE
jgi:hypothetical protein